MKNNRNMDMNFAAEIRRAMEKFRALSKRKIVMLGAGMICAAILTTGTLAYFSGNESAHNVITTGALSMDLVEETEDGEPWPEEGISGVMPGSVVGKKPYVVNDGGVDFYARMRVEMRVTGADGKALSDEYISLNINKTDWTEKDGYDYYNKAVKPGEETAPLFTEVEFGVDMHNAYMNARIEIDVHAEVVQSKNNGTSALNASGWTASK